MRLLCFILRWRDLSWVVAYFCLSCITRLAEYFVQSIIKEYYAHKQPKTTNHLCYDFRLYQQYHSYSMEPNIQKHKHNYEENILSLHKITNLLATQTSLPWCYLNTSYGSMTYLAPNSLLHPSPLNRWTILKLMLKISSQTFLMHMFYGTTTLARSH